MTIDVHNHDLDSAGRVVLSPGTAADPDAWLEAARASGHLFWAPASRPDAPGAVGVEVPATALHDLDALPRRPLFVHSTSATELSDAWWAWADGGRERLPSIPVLFASLAGLGPLHGERVRAYGGRVGPVDPLTFVDTSGYGTQAVDAVMRVLGIDVICFGTDAPYATPAPLRFDASALHAIQSANPARLLAGVPQEIPI